MQSLLARRLSPARLRRLAAAGRAVDAWPRKADDFHDVNQKWTRHGRETSGLGGKQRPPTRADHRRLCRHSSRPSGGPPGSTHQTEKHHLSRAAVRELTAEMRARTASHYEVALLVATYDRRSNDLQKGKRFSLAVALVDEAGTEIRRQRDQARPPAGVEIAAEYPAHGRLPRAATWPFPRSVELLGPEARRFLLKVTSEQGGVVLEWSEPK